MPEIPPDFENDVELLITDYNGFLEIVSNAGLSINDFHFPPLKFHFKGSDGEPFKWVYKKNEKFYFLATIDIYQYFYGIRFFPEKIKGERRWLDKGLTADSPAGLAAVYFREWIENLAYEIKSQEYYDNIFNAKQIFNSFANDTNSPNKKFSDDELSQLKNEFDDVKKMMLEIASLTADNQKMMNEKLDFLIEFAEKNKKNVWQELFVGTIVKTIAPIVGKDAAKTIWDVVKHHFPVAENLLK